jgi:hypothetical protein
MTLGRYSLSAITFAACIAACWNTCSAQNRNATNQNRATGQSSLGQNSFGQGQSSFGGTSGRGQSRGSTGFGSNSFGGGGGTGFGGNTGGAAFGNNQAGVAGQDNFLGADAAQTQNFFRNLNGGQRRNATFDFMIENLNEMRDRGNRGGNNERTPPVRVKLRPAFEPSVGTMAQVTNEVHSRLATSLAEQGVVDSRVSSDGRAMTLEGRVGSEHQRALIVKLLSLEPGVSIIENRLVVDPTLQKEE